MNVFDFLIHPVKFNEFVLDYWDKNYLYISRNDIMYYSEILTLNQMNDFLSQNNIRYPTIRLAKDGKEVPLDKYSNILSFGNYAAEGLINIDKLFACYYDGATIVHQLMKYSVNSLSKFTNELENLFRFNVETTVYLTPENSQGFTAHYDTHSVFILQVYGTKTWRLYNNVKDLPTLDQTFIKSEYKDTEPTKVIELLPGDLLYVPRGLAHDAVTTDGVSLHITLGVFPHLWLDYFKKELENLKKQVEYRESPLGHLVGKEMEDEEKFNKLLETFLSKIDDDIIQLELNDIVISRQMKESSNRLLDLINISDIKYNSTIKRRTNIIYKINQDEKEITLNFYDKFISFPINQYKAIKFIEDNEVFKPFEIHGLDNDDTKLKFCIKLINQGFLTILSI